MLLASLALALCPLPQDSPKQEQAETVFRVEEVQLTVDLSGMTLVKTRPIRESWKEQQRGNWKAKFGQVQLGIELHIFSNEEWRVDLPEDVLGNREWVFNKDRPDEERTSTKSTAWEFEREQYLGGPYGFIPYALVGLKQELGETPSHYLCFAGVTATHNYAIELRTDKVLDKTEQSALLDYLRDHVRYDGEVQNKEWSEEEIAARWKADGPDDLLDDLEYFRTDHFLILTNSSGKKKFAKELEKSYDLIRAMYPFEEREELRLLPIFLFRTPEQYYDFCVKTVGWTLEGAKTSKGVAYKDFYATWYESPKDHVHIHEVTHQLFANRLFLSGGGSWFQEGVAEYMSTSKNDRNPFERLARDRKHYPLREFFTMRSLLGSNKGTRKDGTSPSGEAYRQAACVIEFVKEAKGFKDKFQKFIHAVGAVPRGDLVSIEAALREVYGLGIDDFEKAFLEYWSRR